MNDDGTMARMPDLMGFAQFHGLKIGTIADLIAYRRKYDSLVRVVEEKHVDNLYGAEFDLKIYRSKADEQEHIALVKGDISTPGPVLVRMHAINVLEDILGFAPEGGRHSLVERALRSLAAVERGVFVLIRESHSGTVSQKLRDAAEGGKGEAGGRLIDYGIGAQILLDLGVREMELLSNSPLPKIVGLEGYGLKVVGRRPIE
jgi:3,4-dihydroxy 2-butanone 4-phosphate synthase/GTP cyclohydrolase II